MLWPGKKESAELSHSFLFAGSQAASLSSLNIPARFGWLSAAEQVTAGCCPALEGGAGALMSRTQAWSTHPA